MRWKRKQKAYGSNAQKLRLLRTIGGHALPAPPPGWFNENARHTVHALMADGLVRDAQGVRLTDARRRLLALPCILYTASLLMCLLGSWSSKSSVAYRLVPVGRLSLLLILSTLPDSALSKKSQALA